MSRSNGETKATVQWRSYDGVPNRTGKLALPSVTSPAYLEIVRWQDTTLNQTFFSTLTSTDGSTWTPVLGSTVTIDMAAPAPQLAEIGQLRAERDEALRREADVGFTTCRRGHRIIVHRVGRNVSRLSFH